MAVIRFIVANEPGDFLVLPVSDSLTEGEYCEIVDGNKDDEHEYLYIGVEFDSEREDLIILLA